MRRLWSLCAILAVFGWALGCGGGKTDQAGTDQAGTDQATDQTETAARTQAMDNTETQAESPPVELASVVLTGKLGCGHCTFHVKDSCSLAMEAQDGTVYLLDAGDRQEELMSVRYDRPEVKVTGMLADQDGQKIIHADSVEML